MHCSSLVLALSLLAGAVARADELSVAVAANFAAPLQKLAADFEKESGHKLLVSAGSTGKFYAQIRNGAPFEVLLSADDETPTKLVSDNAAVAGTQFTYAVGKLVLWSAKAGYLDSGAEALKKGDFTHLSLANPKLAPYGAAGIEVMKALGVLSAIEPKIVMAENITQAYQFVATGNAQLGFVALSQVLKDGKIEGAAWMVPANLYQPIRQDAVLLEKGRGKPAARAFLQFLKSDKARAQIKAFGYDF